MRIPNLKLEKEAIRPQPQRLRRRSPLPRRLYPLITMILMPQPPVEARHPRRQSCGHLPRGIRLDVIRVVVCPVCEVRALWPWTGRDPSPGTAATAAGVHGGDGVEEDDGEGDKGAGGSQGGEEWEGVGDGGVEQRVDQEEEEEGDEGEGDKGEEEEEEELGGEEGEDGGEVYHEEEDSVDDEGGKVPVYKSQGEDDVEGEEELEDGGIGVVGEESLDQRGGGGWGVV